ncbi:MAG: phasin family protein [Gammaproteobacteria bacterium]
MNTTVEKYLEPVQELNALAVSNIEKLFEQQVKFLDEAGKIGISQLKSAIEVKDIESLQEYLKSQAEAAKTLSERLIKDSKYAAELATNTTAKRDKKSSKA